MNARMPTISMLKVQNKEISFGKIIIGSGPASFVLFCVISDTDEEFLPQEKKSSLNGWLFRKEFAITSGRRLH